jgi:hypothetical protein
MAQLTYFISAIFTVKTALFDRIVVTGLYTEENTHNIKVYLLIKL